MTTVCVIAAEAAAAFSILIWLDRRFPLRKATSEIIPRLLVNATLSLLAFAAVTFAVQPAIGAALGWSEGRQFGLLRLVELPSAVEILLAFLWFDCSFYLWHRLNHVSPLLWRFHNVHHIDPDLDVTTSFRFHFGEIILSSLFRAFQILLIGPTLIAYLMYELVFQVETVFHHSNVKLPIRWERRLSRVFVTPRMHGIHHSEIRAESRSNFSSVLSLWDRLFATLRLNVPQGALKIGVPAYTSADNSIRNTLRLPFVQQRDYWRRGDGTRLLERADKPQGECGKLAE